ncbi:probable NADH dehydrogenase [ubiquinone] 1 alpha subcomplex subunit 12 [Spodoptera frugiperda]|uniref:NADH dehydrogenase [ubiquinone] 1 alpha subcomplex subunit 12 n=1 Tax=Spodoptera frugiperda TaxID=7108 RepID=A0A9R0EDY1_SPOFR|nr:probable NADH dehydrogenase [ubiquinone] 1 alpha subcomplex subunit 12 [Spodoptera frugiperda]
MSFLALDKWARLFRMIRQSGGIFKATYKLWRFDTLKEGKYVGCDCNGNKYYTNCNYPIGRSRWVEFNDNYKWDYDASQITAEWYGWLHYKTDKLPCEDCAKYELNCYSTAHVWLQPFAENLTATEEAYYPYSTTRHHINVWDGCSLCNRGK